jgi:membrane protein required for colicin V production
MGIPTLVDAVALAPAAALGLVGVWLGFKRSLVSWPMRWLLPLFGAGGAALLAVLYLIVNGELAGLLYLSGTVGRIAVAAAAFLVTLWLQLTFMSNLKERVAVWTLGRRVGSVDRAFGAVFGMACGALLVAVPYTLYESMRPDPDSDPPSVRESLSLPYLRSAADAMRRVASPYWPTPDGQPRRR